MATMDLRDIVIDYVNSADIRLLRMIKALAESYQTDEKDVALGEVHYQMMDERRASHMAGESESLTWDQVRKNARNAKK
ncbi:hypothetical protein [Robertkochia sediminum]|uniref:hypothetical protein n=1 Tax=Robertkochia sediminum TaxID=2785326 RepID=UPI001F489E95|nr:hypothetical protein [Robertkochia sediminum]